MSRRQVVGFAVFFVLLGLALLLRGGDPAPAQAGRPDLATLRAEAALAPCPQGVSPGLPDLTLPCLGGGPDVRLRGTPSGRPTLVNVWGTWCSPCLRETDELAAFAARAQGQVDLLGVLTTDEVESGLQYTAQVGARWPSVVDDDGRVQRAFAAGPPVTLFVDGGGTIVHVRRGEFTSVEQITDLTARHLGVRL